MTSSKQLRNSAVPSYQDDLKVLVKVGDIAMLAKILSVTLDKEVSSGLASMWLRREKEIARKVLVDVIAERKVTNQRVLDRLIKKHSNS